MKRCGPLQPQRTLVVNVFFLDRVQAVPERKAAGDDQTDQHADQEKQAIGGQGDEQDGNDGDGDEEGSGALQAKTEAGAGHLGIILAPIGMRENAAHSRPGFTRVYR